MAQVLIVIYYCCQQTIDHNVSSYRTR